MQAYAPPAPSGAIEPELADYERELADIDPHTGFDAAAFPDTTFGTTTFDTTAFDTTAFETAAFDGTAVDDAKSGPVEHAHGSASPDSAYEGAAHYEDGTGYEDESGYGDGAPQEDDTAHGHKTAAPVRPARVRPSGSPVPRNRRRSPAKRSALFTVAVPSVCVMGVAGVAAASVGGIGGDNDKQTSASAADAQTVKPSVANNKLDTQLDNLSADTRDFADRASRTQERIDLEAKQEAERRKAAEEAARKERLRPKFALPVAQHGLSAYYGQAGINWMSVHTGIDFPVSYGTQVMAATDGTVRMQYNTSYGNMAIVTAKDGTETWYCHLSSYRVSSGSTVKAGDVIAFSGNSGNSTGPHLHFEVRPGGGAAIDPLPWLRSHGLDPS
jgi:murein DD-endopeptidase MepM/ murein hydrolase activator NlpD